MRRVPIFAILWGSWLLRSFSICLDFRRIERQLDQFSSSRYFTSKNVDKISSDRIIRYESRSRYFENVPDIRIRLSFNKKLCRETIKGKSSIPQQRNFQTPTSIYRELYNGIRRAIPQTFGWFNTSKDRDSREAGLSTLPGNIPSSKARINFDTAQDAVKSSNSIHSQSITSSTAAPNGRLATGGRKDSPIPPISHTPTEQPPDFSKNNRSDEPREIPLKTSGDHIAGHEVNCSDPLSPMNSTPTVRPNRAHIPHPTSPSDNYPNHPHRKDITRPTGHSTTKNPCTKPSRTPIKGSLILPISVPTLLPSSREPASTTPTKLATLPVMSPSPIAMPSVAPVSSLSQAPSRRITQPSLPAMQPQSPSHEPPANNVPLPTPSPSALPSVGPFTNLPMTNSSPIPSRAPIKSHNVSPPTSSPSDMPGVAPVSSPSEPPSSSPSEAPSHAPSVSPTLIDVPPPSPSPSAMPSVAPVSRPSEPPSSSPSEAPSYAPSVSSSLIDVPLPTASPSAMLSIAPISSPLEAPPSLPMTQPSSSLSQPPSQAPSAKPSLSALPPRTSLPSRVPSVAPASRPSEAPSSLPMTKPSLPASQPPSHAPSVSPSLIDMPSPSPSPSAMPNVAPVSRHQKHHRHCR